MNSAIDGDRKAGAEMADGGKPEDSRTGLSQASILTDLALANGAKLWHAPDGEAFLSVPVNGHLETLPIGSSASHLWLRRLYYKETGRAAGNQAVEDAGAQLSAMALFDGEEHQVFVRVGRQADAIFIDLGDPSWSAIEVTSKGWRLVTEPEVRFRRPNGLLALPVPVRGGSLDLLRQFINVASDDDYRLLIVCMVSYLCPEGPYVILVLQGEQGSAKSTAARVERAIIDPNRAPVRSAPRTEQGLMIAATSSHLLAFDNLSNIQPSLADALCRLATGGGIGERELYTNRDEVILEAQRPIILNGIPDLLSRADLADRAVLLRLLRIDETERRSESELWADFEKKRALILGALLDALVATLQVRLTVKVESLPRMADFAIIGAAVAEHLGWTQADFLAAYKQNREEVTSDVVAASEVADFLDRFMRNRNEWTGTATDLYSELTIHAAGKPRSRSCPASPQALSAELRRLAPELRRIGVEITFHRSTNKDHKRLLTIATIVTPSPEASTTSAPDETSDTSDASDTSDDELQPYSYVDPAEAEAWT